MKTINEIKKEIKQFEKWHANPLYSDTPEYKKAGRRVVFLRQYVSYIQAGAQEKYLKKDLEVLNKRLDIIEKGYGKWLSFNKEYDQLKNPETKYNSIMGTRKIKRQIEALEYLLN